MTSTTRERQSSATARDFAALACVMFAAALFYFSTLDVHGFWFDEVQSAVDSRLPYAAMVKSRAANGHPPFFHSLLWLIQRTAGENEIIMRTPAVLFMLASAATLHLLLRREAGSLAAVLGAVLLLVAPLDLVLAQLARNYSLVLLLALLSIHVLVAAERDGRDGAAHETHRQALAFGLLALLLLYTHYSGALVVGALLAYVVIRRRPFWRLAGAGLTAGLAFVPFLVAYRAEHDPQARLGWIETLPHELECTVFAKGWIVEYATRLDPTVMLPIAAVTVGVALVGAWSLGTCRRPLVVLAFGPAALAAILQAFGWFATVHVAQYLVASLGALTGLFAVGLAVGFRGGRLGRIAAVLVGGACIVLCVHQTRWYLTQGLHPPWRSIAQTVLERMSPDERFALPGEMQWRWMTWKPLAYYFPKPLYDLSELSLDVSAPRDWKGEQEEPAASERWILGPEVQGVWVYLRRPPLTLRRRDYEAYRHLERAMPHIERIEFTYGHLVHLRRAPLRP